MNKNYKWHIIKLTDEPGQARHWTASEYANKAQAEEASKRTPGLHSVQLMTDNEREDYLDRINRNLPTQETIDKFS